MAKLISTKKNYLEPIFLLIKLSKFLSIKRKKQTLGIFFLMILSSLSEIITIASVIPFLSVINNKENFWNRIKDIQIFQNSMLKTSDDFLIFSIILLAITALLTAIVRITNIFLNTKLAGTIASDISCQCYLNEINQPYEYYLLSNSSKLISTLTNDIRRTMYSLNLFLQVILSSLISFSIFLYLIIVDWQICLFCSGCLSFTYLIIAYFSNSALKSNSKIISRNGDYQIRSMQEGLGSMRNMIMSGSQKNYQMIYQSFDRPLRIAETQNVALGNFPRYALESLGLVILCAASFILIKKDPSSNNFIPLLGTFALASQRLIPSMQQIYGGWAGLVSYGESLKNVLKILSLRNKRNNNIKNSSQYLLKDFIQLRSVNYKYKNSADYALKNINFTIKKSEVIGIIGKTGVGKSTLLDIIMTSIEPTEGNLIIDNKDVHNISDILNERSWKKSISHVPQTIFLADTSIAGNIALGTPKEEINIKRIKWASEIAQITNFIKKLPQGLNTRVGERGVLLSGGQRQRIGIARALYQNSSLLILDEATSALDTDTETKIIKGISQNIKDFTLIIVAHRLSTLSICDRVINIESGEINEIISKNKFKEKYL